MRLQEFQSHRKLNEGWVHLSCPRNNQTETPRFTEVFLILC